MVDLNTLSHQRVSCGLTCYKIPRGIHSTAYADYCRVTFQQPTLSSARRPKHQGTMSSHLRNRKFLVPIGTRSEEDVELARIWRGHSRQNANNVESGKG